MTQNELVVGHVPLVKSIANRIDAPHLRDDLVGEGMVALVKCAARFDPERGVKFGAYARHRVRGAMIKYLNKNKPTPECDSEFRPNAVGSDGQANEAALRDALSYHLHPVEEWVVVKRYFEKARMDDIAAELGFQESRVSQIHSNAIEKLRKAFSPPSQAEEPQEESNDNQDALLQVVRKMMWDEWGVEVTV